MKATSTCKKSDGVGGGGGGVQKGTEIIQEKDQRKAKLRSHSSEIEECRQNS